MVVVVVVVHFVLDVVVVVMAVIVCLFNLLFLESDCMRYNRVPVTVGLPIVRNKNFSLMQGKSTLDTK